VVRCQPGFERRDCQLQRSPAVSTPDCQQYLWLIDWLVIQIISRPRSLFFSPSCAEVLSQLHSRVAPLEMLGSGVSGGVVIGDDAAGPGWRKGQGWKERRTGGGARAAGQAKQRGQGGCTLEWKLRCLQQSLYQAGAMVDRGANDVRCYGLP
jgi:hypothetical protein